TPECHTQRREQPEHACGVARLHQQHTAADCTEECSAEERGWKGDELGECGACRDPERRMHDGHARRTGQGAGSGMPAWDDPFCFCRCASAVSRCDLCGETPAELRQPPMPA